MPELNVISLQERSQPVPMISREDVRSENITYDDVGSWLLGLDKLVNTGSDSPDPIRRYGYEMDGQSEKVLVIVAEDGTVTDPVAEFRKYAKDLDDIQMSLSDAPQGKQMMLASLEGKLFIRPRGENTYRQVQSHLDLTDPEDPTVKMSLSTPVEKPLRMESSIPEIPAEAIQGSVAPMAEPEKPSLWMRIFSFFYREELAAYEHQMEIYRAHQTLEEMKDQTLQQAREAIEKYRLAQQREQSRNSDRLDAALRVELSEEERKREVEEYDREMNEDSFGNMEDRVEIDPKQQKIDRYNERFPGLYDQREMIKEKMESMLTESNRLSSQSYAQLAGLLLPQGKALGEPEYSDALLDLDAYAGQIDWKRLENLVNTDDNLYEVATACVRKTMELASQYSMESKEFRLFAVAGHEVMQEAMKRSNNSLDKANIPFDVNEFKAAEGIYKAAMLYDANLKAREILYTRLLEHSDEGMWNDSDNLKICGYTLGVILTNTFTDAMIRLNQGDNSLNHVLQGMSRMNVDAFAKGLAEGPLIQNLLEEGPEAVVALLNDPQRLRKFAIEGMKEVNQRESNLVADLNLMERQDSYVVPVDSQGRPEKQPDVHFL